MCSKVMLDLSLLNVSFRLNVVDISFPSEICNKELDEDLKPQILARRYPSGKLVVPQNFTRSKVVVGKIENEEFVVQGRKIALQRRKNCAF